mgnify:FL=1
MKQMFFAAALLLGFACSLPTMAKDAAPAKTETTKAPVKAAPQSADSWDIDTAHSAVNFTVRHMMVSNVRGNFGQVSGKVKYDGKTLTKAFVDATIDAKTISTQEPKRDEHLKAGDFLDTEKYPTMKFVSTKVVPGKNGAFTLEGNFTMHGVTKKVTLNAEGLSKPVMVKGAPHMGVSAKGKLNRKDFGVSYNKTLDNGGAMVGDEINFEIDLELVKSDNKAQA